MKNYRVDCFYYDHGADYGKAYTHSMTYFDEREKAKIFGRMIKSQLDSNVFLLRYVITDSEGNDMYAIDEVIEEV